MKLTQKITLLLLSVALLPMLTGGAILYFSARNAVIRQIRSQLESIATIQKHRAEAIHEQNVERVSSFVSRVQLRIALDRYNKTPNQADRAFMGNLLQEARAQVESFTNLAIVNPQGRVVVSTQNSLVGSDFSRAEPFIKGSKAVSANVFALDGNNMPRNYLSGPLLSGEKLVGVVVIETTVDNLAAITQDHTGLSETGEITLAGRTGSGGAIYLTPLRFDPQAALRKSITPDAGSRAILLALDGVNAMIDETFDYQNKPVIAATRYVSGPDWGLVAKINHEEAFRPINELRDKLLLLGFVFSVMVVFFALYVARLLAAPIIQLDEVAEAAAAGNLSQRASIVSSDEIGNLTGTFNLMLANLEVLDRAKSEFVSLASHQLRTPASGVKAYASLLLDGYAGKLTAKQLDFLHKIYDSNERQLAIIDDMLSVARVESGKMSLNLTSTDLVKLVTVSAEEHKNILKVRRQTLTADYPKTPVNLKIDASKIRMVIDNLLNNASKYSYPGGRIWLKLETARTGVAISVRDEGVGIHLKDQGRLFQKFSRIDNPLTNEYGVSSGLGLYLAKKIVEAHGGLIKINSVAGEGATFTVELPYT